MKVINNIENISHADFNGGTCLVIMQEKSPEYSDIKVAEILREIFKERVNTLIRISAEQASKSENFMLCKRLSDSFYEIGLDEKQNPFITQKKCSSQR